MCKTNRLHDAIDILFDLNNKGFSVIDVYDALLTFIKHTDILLENENIKSFQLCNHHYIL